MRIFAIIGIVVVALISLGAGAYLLFQHFGGHYDVESKAYVDRIIPLVCKDWNEGLVLQESSPELMKFIEKDKEKFDKLFVWFADRLGPLKEYKGSQGEAVLSYTAKDGKILTGSYAVQADFEKGPADIQVRVVLHGDKWQILLFKVNSDRFLAGP